MQLEIVYDEQKWTCFKTLDRISLAKLMMVAKKRLTNLPEQFGLNYFDAEGDQIDVICSDDWNSFKEQYAGQNGSIQIFINVDGYPVAVDPVDKKKDW